MKKFELKNMRYFYIALLLSSYRSKKRRNFLEESDDLHSHNPKLDLQSSLEENRAFNLERSIKSLKRDFYLKKMKRFEPKNTHPSHTYYFYIAIRSKSAEIS